MDFSVLEGDKNMGPIRKGNRKTISRPSVSGPGLGIAILFVLVFVVCSESNIDFVYFTGKMGSIFLF